MTANVTFESNPSPGQDPASYLSEEYARWQALFGAQPVPVQRFLNAQARQTADAVIQRHAQVRFALPEQVVVNVLEGGTDQPVPTPAESREQLAGGLLDRLTGADVRAVLHERLTELEQAPQPAVAAGAGLLRYAAVVYMVHDLLPAGRSVTYITAPGEEIPSLPAPGQAEPEEALTAPTDVILAQEPTQPDAQDEAVVVPYVPAARRFYLPQWVAFDDQGRLLVSSVYEAEAHLASMQRFLSILHTAVALAPYIVADPDYQRKRYGMLGQLVNQGRALARYQTQEIIRTIQRRAAAQDLNRGLSLGLPYFDDQTLEVKTHPFQVIPAGRIMFIPAFVVRAVRGELAKVAQDTRLNPSTRQHLLAELKTLELAFLSDSRRS